MVMFIAEDSGRRILLEGSILLAVALRFNIADPGLLNIQIADGRNNWEDFTVEFTLRNRNDTISTKDACCNSSYS